MFKYKFNSISISKNNNYSIGVLPFFLFALLIIISSFELYSQEDVTEDDSKIHNGGFGGSVLKYTIIKEQGGILIGYYGGWLIDHKYAVGAGGYSLFSRIKADNLSSFPPGETFYLKSTYGGLILEYIIYPDNFVRANLHLLIGGGEVKYVNYDNYDFNYHGKSGYYLFEPEINIDLHVMKNILLCIGGGYRFVTGVDLEGVSNKGLSGFSANFKIKLGGF